jgi:sensor c-di-GMP phosphodiesterase-like protein
MGLEVVAEGIETPGQYALLNRLGVQFGQGWHFGRPAAAEDLVLRPVVSRPA